jgi:hypothetical protein
LEAITTATTTTYIDINLDQNGQTATIKLSNPAFNIKAIVWALKQAGYTNIQVVESDYFPEKARAELR